MCWENPENAERCPENFKAKLSLDDIKKKIAETN